jgi:hypothetical protein
MKALHPLWANDVAARSANLPSSPGLNGVIMRWRLREVLGEGGTRDGEPSGEDAQLGGRMGLRKQTSPSSICSPLHQGTGWDAPDATCTLGTCASAKFARRCFSAADKTLWEANLAQFDQQPLRRW